MAESQIERKLLWTEKQIESLHDQVAKLMADNSEMNQILANVERHLDGVKYSGTYDVGVAELKRQLDLANKRCALLGISK